MGHQRQVLDQPTRFSFGCIAGTQHSPLTRLESSGTAHFTRLLELRANSCHHAQRANEGQAAEDMSNACAFHLEPLERPVPSADSSGEARCDIVVLHLQGVESVEL